MQVRASPPRGVGAEIRLLRAPQVSGSLALFRVSYTHRFEGNRAHPGLFRVRSGYRSGGGSKSQKSRLWQIPMRGCFALWMLGSTTNSQGTHTHPGLFRLNTPPWEIWTHFKPPLTIMQVMFALVACGGIHILNTLFYVSRTISRDPKTAVYVPAELFCLGDRFEFRAPPSISLHVGSLRASRNTDSLWLPRILTRAQ